MSLDRNRAKDPAARPLAGGWNRTWLGVANDSECSVSGTALIPQSAELLRAILAGDRQAAYRILKAGLDGGSPAHVYEELVCPAMHSLGDMWLRDEISVADEHLATATADAAIAGLYPDFDWPGTRTSRVFVACPEGERHALGARMLADLLALDGWDESYFGADVPTGTLARKAAELRPRVVALSVTITNHLASAREAAAAIRDVSPQTKILVGGRAVAGAAAARAADRVGTDIVAGSAAEAVAMVRDWR